MFFFFSCSRQQLLEIAKSKSYLIANKVVKNIRKKGGMDFKTSQEDQLQGHQRFLHQSFNSDHILGMRRAN